MKKLMNKMNMFLRMYVTGRNMDVTGCFSGCNRINMHVTGMNMFIRMSQDERVSQDVTR